jgi:RND family efflux transporter MFP subunit
MNALVHAALNNAAWATVLALAAATGARLWRRRPAVAHALWLLVLLKLLAPSIVEVGVPGIGDLESLGGWDQGPRAQRQAFVQTHRGSDPGAPRPSQSGEVRTSDADRLLSSSPPSGEKSKIPAAPGMAVGQKRGDSAEDARRQGEGETSAPRRQTESHALSAGLSPRAGKASPPTRPSELGAGLPTPPGGMTECLLRSALLPAIALLWLAGTALWWSRVWLSSARFRQLMKSAQPAKPEVCARVAAIAECLSLRTVPDVWMLPARISPMVWVTLRGRSRVVLPEELWNCLDTQQQDSVLAHELAHVKRRDHWVRRLEAAVLGVYWWDPIAWWARREIEHAEERCCDAWALWAVPGAGGAYAEALVATAAFLAGARPSMPAGACGVGRLVPLKRRLQMVVDNSANASLSRGVPRALLILGVAGLVLLPALVVSAPADGRAQSVAWDETQQDKPKARTPAEPKVAKPQSSGAPKTKADDRRFRLWELTVIHPVLRELGDQLEPTELARLDARKTEVSAGAGGHITAFEYGRGMPVMRGAVLFEIDHKAFQAEIVKAEALVRRAQARLKRSRSAPPSVTAKESGAPASDRALESLSTAEAEAELSAAEADCILARLKLDSARGVAPIDGIITQVTRQLGEYIQANEHVLTIITLDPLYANFYLDEGSGWFLSGMRKRAQGGGARSSELAVEIGMRGEEGFPHRGTLEFIDPQVQPIRETAFHCRAVIPNPDGTLKPGMLARLRVICNAPHPAVIVPEELVEFQQDGAWVYVLTGQNVVERREISVGIRGRGSYEVTRGLRAADRIAHPREANALIGYEIIPREAPTDSQPKSMLARPRPFQ